ncbi:hypothetical protein J2T56_003049 [Natronobacillus azotifigens]|uniref:ABC transporter permease n=1 Tax=Natronobacillus azotifigens TaxID=472978 RepID=A0A9J6RFY0_9BACI|nr:ABC transporter permease [Natronobacillus azotifigens]MCZ0704512.1 ABC transporter permease [Natronobacillus azotifigens]
MRQYMLVWQMEAKNYKQLCLHCFILIAIIFFSLYYFGLMYGKYYEQYQANESIIVGNTMNTDRDNLEQLALLDGIKSYILLANYMEFFTIEGDDYSHEYHVAALPQNYVFDSTFQGRFFTEEEQVNGDNVAIIPYPYALLSNSKIGDTVEINHTSYQIIGIAPYMHYASFIITEKQLFDQFGQDNTIEIYTEEGFALKPKARTSLITNIESLLQSPVIDEETSENDLADFMNEVRIYSLILFAFAIANILYIYSYILETRKKQISIYRLNGASKGFIARILLVGLLANYTICFFIAYGLIVTFHGLIAPIVIQEQLFMLTSKDFFAFFITMLMIYILLLFLYIRKWMNGSIVRSLKGGV